MFFAALPILFIVQSLLTLGCAAALMRPALAGWRESLRERRWWWLRWLLSLSPALFYLLRPWLMQFVWGVAPAAGVAGTWISVATVVPAALLPALAACWWCLPEREGVRISHGKACALALGIGFLNYVIILGVLSFLLFR